MDAGTIASEQIYFENTRGPDIEGKYLADKNTPSYIFNRLRQELDELEAAYNNESPQAQLLELADVFIFAGSIGAHICLENGMSTNTINEAIKLKLQRNEIKYHEDHFKRKTVDEAIIFSRQKHTQRT